LKGKFNDLPNLLFFTEACDTTCNWIPFFTNPRYSVTIFYSNLSQFLDYRNVWILNPRNFGNSDRNSSFDLSECADDVARFMYQNKISTATLGGHGFGGKVALATGMYHYERVTGSFRFSNSRCF
jgi:pimeloyl-ACP methyl ester carboxylesterase